MNQRRWPPLALGLCLTLIAACKPLARDAAATPIFGLAPPATTIGANPGPPTPTEPELSFRPATATRSAPPFTSPPTLTPVLTATVVIPLPENPPADARQVEAPPSEPVEIVAERAPIIAGVLASGGQVSGNLTKEASDVWTFTTEAGRYATLSLRPITDNSDMTLTLLDPAGRLLATVDNGYAGDPEVMTDILLPESGAYSVMVAEFFKEAGGYELSLTLVEQPQFSAGGAIEMGQEIVSELLANARHSWSFSGVAGQSVSIILTPRAEQLDVILDLRGPDGRRLEALDEGFSGDAEVIVGFILPVTGAYTVRVYGFAGQAGGYALSLDQGGDETANFYDAGQLLYGDSKREVLQQDEAHAWFFNGLAGEHVSIIVRPLGANLDMDIWLLDPQLERLSKRDEFLSGEAETIEVGLPADGEYLVLVREFFGEPGEYEISLSTDSNEEIAFAGNLAFGQTVNGALVPGRGAVWFFTGNSGDVIHIALAPMDANRDLVLVLKRPDDIIAISADDTVSGDPERLRAFTLTADGAWAIVIQEFFGDAAHYSLTLTRQE